jgi:hypothetical protein
LSHRGRLLLLLLSEQACDHAHACSRPCCSSSLLCINSKVCICFCHPILLYILLLLLLLLLLQKLVYITVPL